MSTPEKSVNAPPSGPDGHRLTVRIVAITVAMFVGLLGGLALYLVLEAL